MEKIIEYIRKVSEKLDKARIMTFCGTHEHTIATYGIRSILPENIELIPGPGCPVCITPASIIDEAISLALNGVEVITFGDSFKLPGIKWTKKDYPKNLMEAKERGGLVRVVYSPLEVIKEKDKEKVFLAIGFETTVPATISLLERSSNIKILSAHRLTPPVMKYALEKHGKGNINGIIAPGHVSAIIGAKSWEFLPKEFGIPTVISGFEPTDVILSIAELVMMIKNGDAKLVNTYNRVVKYEGNVRAQKAIEHWFEVKDASWRGFGIIPNSGLFLKEKWKYLDAYWQYGLKLEEGENDNPPGCRCAEVTLGMTKPNDCPHFLKGCIPERPYGPCMVSAEGTCRIWAMVFGRKKG
ncbi:MAG: hydrogenase formation protein HypD [Fervidicoccaceae archaeon]|jgi:hydrogenase expression/formation protein HypD|nr:MAG: hydrogenase formation protein HypD [Fervidicoccus sp.]